jgi:hypothetical protein
MAGAWVGTAKVPILVLSDAEATQAVWVGCQPWFYLRLKAYGFIGLSEGAYGGP